jgi:hypothetical protein
MRNGELDGSFSYFRENIPCRMHRQEEICETCPSGPVFLTAGNSTVTLIASLRLSCQRPQLSFGKPIR